MTTRIGGISASLFLETAQFLRDTKRAQSALASETAKMRRSFQQVQRASTQLSRQFGQLRSAAVALAGVLAVRQFAQFTRSAIQSASAIQDVANKVGLSTKALQQLRFAAEQTGVAQQTLDMAMQRFSRRLGEVAQGQGELLKTATQYGIQLRTNDGRMRANVDVLKDFADVIAAAESDQERLRIAFKLFDSEGAALVNTLREGRVGLEQFMQQAVAVGAVMDSTIIAQAKIAGDSMAALQRVFRTAFDTAIIRGFAGELTVSADALRSAREVGENFGRVVGNSMRAVARAAEFVAENIRAITAALAAFAAFKTATIFIGVAQATARWVTALQAAAVAQGGLNAVMRANPIGLVATAVAGAVSAYILFRDKTIEVGDTTLRVGNIIAAVWRAVTLPLRAMIGEIVNVSTIMRRLIDRDFEGAAQAARNVGDAFRFEFGEVVRTLTEAPPKAEELSGALDGGAGSVTSAANAAADAIANFTAEQEEAEDQVGKTIAALKQEVSQLEQRIFAQRKGEDALKRQILVQEAFNELQRTGVRTGSEEERQISRLVLRRGELREQLEQEREAREEAARVTREQREEQRRLAEQQRELLLEPFRNAIRGIQDAFTDTFTRLFDGGIKTFGDLASSIKGIFIRLAGEIASLLVFRPVVTGVLGSLGLGSVASSLTGGAGGGFNLTSLPIGSIRSLFSGGGLLGGSLAAGGAVPGTVAGTIGPAAGFATPGASSLAGGAASASALSLTGVLGAAGLGAFGGGLLSSFIGGNQVGGSIGGGLGAAAGFALGGPVGGLIGSLGGGLLGGLFGGGKPSDKAQFASVDLASGRIFNVHGLSGKKFSAENAQAAQQVAQAVSQLVQQAGGLRAGTLQVGVGSRDGLRFTLRGRETNIGAGSPQDLLAAIQGALGPELERSRVLAAIEQLTDQSSDLERAIAAVNAQFNPLINSARRLGIETATLVAARDRELEAIRNQARAPFTQAAGEIVGFLQAQRLAPGSSLSPTQRLAEAQQQFGALLERVRGGEVGATRALTGAAGTLLDFGRQQFASTVDFAMLERSVRSSLLSVGETLVSDEFFDANVEATRQQTDVISSDLDDVKARLDDLRNEFRVLGRKLAA